MQEGPAEPYGASEIPRPTVGPVAADRMADRRKMNSDRLCSACPRRGIQEGGPGPPLANHDRRLGVPTLRLIDDDAIGPPSQWCVDRESVVGDDTAHKSHVSAFDGMSL